MEHEANGLIPLDPVLLLHFVAVPGLPVDYILFCGSDHSWQFLRCDSPSWRYKMANILTVASLLLVAVTVVTNGWQAREVARQTGIFAHTNRALLAE
jgi:hypothetical protein